VIVEQMFLFVKGVEDKEDRGRKVEDGEMKGLISVRCWTLILKMWIGEMVSDSLLMSLIHYNFERERAEKNRGEGRK
jgi:hypothetical protein